jgi:hypothetical protein
MISFGGRPAVGFGDPPCPSNPPPRAGYAVWKGGVPPELTQWAVTLRNHIAPFPYGQEWTMRWGTTDVVARKDHHEWTYRKQPDGTATLLTGICVPGITLYRPPPPTGVSGLGIDYVLDPATASPDPQLALYPALPPPDRTDWGPVVGCFAALTATVGLFSWGLHAAGSR